MKLGFCETALTLKPSLAAIWTITALAEKTDRTYPYSLEVLAIPGSGRDFQWVIRKHGKLLQRSDRKHPSEAKAREQGLEVIEKLLTGGDERGF